MGLVRNESPEGPEGQTNPPDQVPASPLSHTVSSPPPPAAPKPLNLSGPSASSFPPATSAPLRLPQGLPQRPRPFVVAPLPIGRRPGPHCTPHLSPRSPPPPPPPAQRPLPLSAPRAAPAQPPPALAQTFPPRPDSRSYTKRCAIGRAGPRDATRRGRAATAPRWAGLLPLRGGAVGGAGGRCPRDSRSPRPAPRSHRCRVDGSAPRPGRCAPPCRGTALPLAARTEGAKAPGTSAS